MSTTRDAELAVVVGSGHVQSDHAAAVARRVVAANERGGLELVLLDVDADGERIRDLGIIQLPAFVLTVEGAERGRLSGAQSHRALLHMVLPELYEPDEAVTLLGRQLESPGEQFPRRVLRRHERVGKAARLALLADVPLFESLPRRQLAELAAVADEVVVEDQCVVMRQGDPGGACFVVADGRLDVRRGRRRMATLGPGDVAGEMSLLDGGERTASVIAAERSVLISLDRDTFISLLQSSPGLAIALLGVLSARLRRADTSIVG